MIRNWFALRRQAASRRSRATTDQSRPLGRVAIGAQLGKYNFCTAVARSCIGIQRARVHALVRAEPLILHFPLAPEFALREADRMDDLALNVRVAQPADAAEVARVYIESWHDTYPAILSSALLCSMTPKGQTARWLAAIRNQRRESVLVAENAQVGIVGMASVGPSRDRVLAYDGEVYTLYVDPAFYGRGAGRALLKAAFALLRQRGRTSCVIWAHAGNNARFFYETMGGAVVAERKARMMGDVVPEMAFGWKTLALAERSHAK